MVRQYRLVTNGGYDFAKEGQIADLVEVETSDCVILRHDSWQMHPRGDRAWRFWPSEVEEVAAPKFKVGDKVRIVGPSQTGGDVRRGEVVTVSSVQTDHRGNTWYNVTVKPRCSLSTYAATSLEAAVEPPAVKAPYIVMLRGKDGRLAPSSHPAEHTDRQEARDEAARLAKRHAQPFEVWQRDYKVEPPAPPKHKFSVGDQVRVIGNTLYHHHLRIGSIATITKLLNDPPAYEVTGVCDDRLVVSQSLIAHDVESL